MLFKRILNLIKFTHNTLYLNELSRLKWIPHISFKFFYKIPFNRNHSCILNQFPDSGYIATMADGLHVCPYIASAMISKMPEVWRSIKTKTGSANSKLWKNLVKFPLKNSTQLATSNGVRTVIMGNFRQNTNTSYDGFLSKCKSKTSTTCFLVVW